MCMCTLLLHIYPYILYHFQVESRYGKDPDLGQSRPMYQKGTLCPHIKYTERVTKGIINHLLSYVTKKFTVLFYVSL